MTLLFLCVFSLLWLMGTAVEVVRGSEMVWRAGSCWFLGNPCGRRSSTAKEVSCSTDTKNIPHSGGTANGAADATAQPVLPAPQQTLAAAAAAALGVLLRKCGERGLLCPRQHLRPDISQGARAKSFQRQPSTATDGAAPTARPSPPATREVPVRAGRTRGEGREATHHQPGMSYQ